MINFLKSVWWLATYLFYDKEKEISRCYQEFLDEVDRMPAPEPDED